MKQSILTALSAALATPTMDEFRNGGVFKALKWAARSAWILLNPGIGLKVAQVLTSTQTRPLLRSEPRLMFKYLAGYVAMDLSRVERAELLIHHYTLLRERADENFFQRIVDRRLELWQLAIGENVYSICLSFPATHDDEGDLALYFQYNGDDIYALSFTIGPGSIAGVDVRNVMYIARVQGEVNEFERIREATKACQDVSPAALLLAAAEGIAQALDLERMIGIGASTQIKLKSGISEENFIKAYDEFWTAVGGVRLDRNMYDLKVPMLSKPIQAVKRGHRSRTQRKRRFKKAVKDQVRETFSKQALLCAR